MSFQKHAPNWRLPAGCWLVIGCLMLAACGGGSGRAVITDPVSSTTTPVVLSTATGSAQVQAGASLVVTASVTNDTSKAGVTWILTGEGTLTDQTKDTATYNAPTGFAGTLTPVITATSIADPTKSNSAPLIVSGLPIIDATTLFPGNLSSPYGAAIVVSAGLAPFTWSLSSGTLPAGITLGTTATTAFVGLSGTPTETGTFTFQVKVVDKNANSATVDLSLTINAAAACLLNGHYALLVTGFTNNTTTVGAASLNIVTAGTVSGTQDYKTSSATVSESVSGTCTTRKANNGELKLTGTAHSPSYDYAITTGFNSGRVQLENGRDIDSSSGLLLQQDAAAFSLPTLAGSYAFGTLGSEAGGARMAVVGAITLDAGGLVTAGRVDANGTTALGGTALSGNLGSPDANGRTTLQLTAGAQTYKYAVHVIDANRLLLVSADDPAAPRLAGFMTRQSGIFDSTSLANPAIMSLWGANSKAPPAVLELGRLSNANTSAGTVDLLVDRAENAGGALAQPFSGATYAIESADGRFTLSFVSGAVTRHFAGYLDGAANGYLLEVGGASGSAGFLEAQAPGPFSATIPGLFVSGTQYAQYPGPMALLPSVNLAAGSISAGSANGFYAFTTTTGRGVGSLTVTGSGNGTMVLYVVGPNKVRILRLGTLSRSPTMEWLGS